MSNQTKILFAVLSTYEREGWIHPSILKFFCDLPFNKEYAYRMINVHNFKPAAAGRNVFCNQAKDADADWLCMIDNDMAVPHDLLDTLKDVPKDASIVVPSFYMWAQDELKLTLCWGMDKAHDGFIGRLEAGFHELTKCGTGVIFIKPEVFRALEYPYFKYLWNADQGLQGTEDIQFCVKAREKGFKIYGNAGLKVGHYHSVDLASLWDWYDARAKELDIRKQASVDSQQKDPECSSGATAPSSVPATA